MGTPISMWVKNEDARSEAYNEMATKFRPSHADYTYTAKYGVRNWQGGGRVVPIPGASAVLAAVAASGLAGPRWGFEGFLPRAGRERRERLARIATDERATVLFEAPTRLAATLRDLVAACGADRRAAVCRELTKLHEQIARGTLGELQEQVASGIIPARGEVAIVVAGGQPPAAGGAGGSGVDAETALALVDALVRGGASRGDWSASAYPLPDALENVGRASIS